MVLDVEIGEKNGIDAVAESQADGSRYTDFVCLFTHSRFGSGKGVDAGGIAYSRKPFEMEELVAYIRRHTPCFHPKGLSIRNVQSESRRQYVVQRRGTCEKAD